MPKILHDDQVSEYDRDGLVFPISALSRVEVDFFRRELQRLTDALGGRMTSMQMRHLHLHHRWAYDLATHSRVLDTVEDVLGPDILIHSTTMFAKYKWDRTFVSWHQDGFYMGLSSLKFASSWIALTDSSSDNGCMQAIRGSHLGGMLEHCESARSPYNLLDGLEIAGHVGVGERKDVVLAPGEMSLHHVALIHGSAPNVSGRARIGYAVRYMSPEVAERLDHYPVVLARGRCPHSNFRILSEPPSLNIDAAIEAQGALAQWVRTSRASSKAVPLPTNLGIRWREFEAPRAGRRK